MKCSNVFHENGAITACHQEAEVHRNGSTFCLECSDAIGARAVERQIESERRSKVIKEKYSNA